MFHTEPILISKQLIMNCMGKATNCLGEIWPNMMMKVELMHHLDKCLMRMQLDRVRVGAARDPLLLSKVQESELDELK